VSTNLETKPVAFLKLETDLGSCGCIEVASFFGVTSQAKQATFHQLLISKDRCQVIAILRNREIEFSVQSMPKSYVWEVLLVMRD
jgi:hypothetical protein